MTPLISIKDLSIQFNQDGKIMPVVQIHSLEVEKGKTLAIVGESGSGKSVTALSLLKLLPPGASVSGSIHFFGEQQQPINIQTLSAKAMGEIRGKKIAMIFQEPMTSLNPVLTCGQQVIETIIRHAGLSKKLARQQTIALFEQVELPDPATMLERYPHQLSGGQKQRVMIAMAISCNPDLLIADEPTTALDVSVQKSILDLIKRLQEEKQLTVLLITHDLGLVADIADDIAVMYRGKIVESGKASTVLNNPKHEYTRAMLACRVAANEKGKKLKLLADLLPGPGKEFQPETISEQTEPIKKFDTEPLLSVRDLKVYFPASRDLLGRPKRFLKAVDGISFDVKQNETIGIVGESGSGKSTLARAILQLIIPTSGQVSWNGKNLLELPGKALRDLRREMQIIFQDPYGSLNPRQCIGEAILEPMLVHGDGRRTSEKKEQVFALLEQVHLQADHYYRYPHQFSGGQRQRICIARALSLKPNFLVFDESVSALDVSVQAQVLNLITELKSNYQFSSLFISHDLAVVHYISDRILVMKDGKIVESGAADQVWFNPGQPYTQKLIEAIPGKKLVTA